MRGSLLLNSCFALWALSLPATAAEPAPTSPDCAGCAENRKALEQAELNRDRNVTLLGKNREYLAALSADQASKILKVESNTVIILRKLDVLKADISRLETEYEKDGCRKCPTNK